MKSIFNLTNLQFGLEDTNAEAIVLAGLIQEPELLSEVTKYVRNTDFSDLFYRDIFNSICTLYVASKPINEVSIYAELEKKYIEKVLITKSEQFFKVTSTEIITDSIVISASQKVKELSVRRTVKEMGKRLHDQATDLTCDFLFMLDNVQKTVLDLDLEYSNKNLKHIKEVANSILNQVKESHEKQKLVTTGIKCGIKPIDTILGGFKDSDYIVIGARPSVGKTSLALSMASNMSKNGNKVGFFSLEMNADMLTTRIISSRSKINNFKIKNSILDKNEINDIEEVVKQLDDECFYIEDTPNLSMFNLISQSRVLKKQYEIDIIFIDYIGLISSDIKSIPRHEQISTISRNIKALARELKVPIITLCQLNRDSEGKEPTLYNLRDSGAIEQDADVVLLLHKNRIDKEDEKEEENSTQVEIFVDIAKHRNGPIGKVNMTFSTDVVSFSQKIE